jgi:hypothetical protein
MELALGAICVLALAALLLQRLQAVELGEQLAAERQARQADTDRLLLELGEARRDLSAQDEAWRDQLQHALTQAMQERHALLERIQRPAFEPVPAHLDEPAPAKLHISEDDEIQVHRAEVAAAIDAELAARLQHGYEVPALA